MWEACSIHREMIDTYILVENPEGKRPVGRCTHKWEDNIKMDLKELECM